MPSSLRKIRERMGMSQVEFARKIGRSYARVQQYEQGARVSPEVQRTIVELATQYGIQDLVDDFLQEHSAGAGGGQVFEPVPVLPAGKGAPSKWHALLDKIFSSGHREAIRALEQNLTLLARLVDVETRRK